MDEKLYQNIDLPQNNPLDTPQDLPKDTEKKPINPKILLLIILGGIIFILLILSLVVTQIRNKNSNTQSIPTPTPATIIPTPNDSLIPSPYQESFKNLEKSFEQDPDLPAPQIDITVGE